MKNTKRVAGRDVVVGDTIQYDHGCIRSYYKVTSIDAPAKGSDTYMFHCVERGQREETRISATANEKVTVRITGWEG